jgi:hypothetical protein
MLSKREREYLSGRLEVSKDYERRLLYSIRKKLKEYYYLELPLIQGHSALRDLVTSVTEFCNSVNDDNSNANRRIDTNNVNNLRNSSNNLVRDARY